MLILVHYLTLLIYQLFKDRKRIKYLQSIKDNMEIVKHQTAVAESSKVDLEYKLKFDPPVFRQRYAKVYEILTDERWRKQIKKLCDFGCAELGLFVFIKQHSSLNDIYLIDIEEDILRDNLRKIYPLTIEYLQRREEPLEVNVFAGSVADPDYRLSNTDAVVAIELIEHLYPDTLDAFPYNIFGFIEPKIVIITTPNADFNVLFSSDSKRMRHYDHKFEWTREQFSDWAFNVISRFPDYTVSISGIGPGPDGTEHLGHCSQMALFIRKDVLDDSYVSKRSSAPCRCDRNSGCKGSTSDCMLNCSCLCPLCCPGGSFGVCTYYSCSKQIMEYEIQDNKEQDSLYGIYYKFIEKVEYPFERDDRTEEEKMMDEFKYRINTFGNVNGRFYVEERERFEIPLVDLNYGPNSCSITESELSNLLTRNGYKIEVCVIQETGQFLKCVVYKPEMIPSSASDTSSYENDFSVFPPATDAPYTDWDDWN